MVAAIGSVWQNHLIFSDSCTNTRIRDCLYECNQKIDNAIASNIECDSLFFFIFKKRDIRYHENTALMLSRSDTQVCEMSPHKRFS